MDTPDLINYKINQFLNILPLKIMLELYFWRGFPVLDNLIITLGWLSTA